MARDSIEDKSNSEAPNKQARPVSKERKSQDFVRQPLRHYAGRPQERIIVFGRTCPLQLGQPQQPMTPEFLGVVGFFAELGALLFLQAPD